MDLQPKKKPSFFFFKYNDILIKKEGNKMKLGITSDHRGYNLKEALITKLNPEYTIIDYGCSTPMSVDYPDYAFKLGKALQNQEIDFGIAICGSGIGISIACNKVKGIRAARVVDLEDVKETRQDNDANIICLKANIPLEEAYQLIKTFVTIPFSNEERHLRRINKIKEYEEHEC